MVLDKNDSDVSTQIKEYGWYQDEKLETKVFKNCLKPGMTVLDLGANIGFYSMFARSIVGTKGRVFAFEPSPLNASLIRASANANSFDNVTVIEAAVADRVGNAPLYLSPETYSEHSLLNLESKYDPRWKNQKIDVRVVTVDDYLKKTVGNFKVDFIKMDIEGSESRALKGMKKVLDENIHIILMTEFWPNGFKEDNMSPRHFLETLHKAGFLIHHIDSFEKKVYEVTVDEMMEIVDSRSKDKLKQNEVMRVWGWYTNLLCTRTPEGRIF